MRKVVVSTFAFLALAAIVGFLATSGLPGGGNNSTSGVGASEMPAASSTGAVGFDASLGAAEPGSARSVTAPAGASGSGSASSIGGLPTIGPDIVETASLTVQVPKGGFDQAFSAAALVAGRYGGYVESSSTSGTRVHSGTLTIRVPNASFNHAMDDLAGLGAVQSRSMSGQDVTNEYVDLNARLRTWEAQEAVLLKLMRSATTVEATLRVQSNLQDVQFRIEQIKGQLRVLENQVSLATIEVSLHEPGAVVHPLQRPKPNERPSLAEAWTKAVNGFLGVLYATVVGLGYLVPIALIAVAVWFGVRRVRPAATT